MSSSWNPRAHSSVLRCPPQHAISEGHGDLKGPFLLLGYGEVIRFCYLPLASQKINSPSSFRVTSQNSTSKQSKPLDFLRSRPGASPGKTPSLGGNPLPPCSPEVDLGAISLLRQFLPGESWVENQPQPTSRYLGIFHQQRLWKVKPKT